MMNNFILVIWLALGLTTSSAIFSKPNCLNPQIEYANSKWFLYRNLISINIQECILKGNTRYRDCQHQEPQDHGKLDFFDITGFCTDEMENVTFKDKPCVQDKNIRTYQAKVSLETDELLLPEGGTCRYSLGFCYTAEGGRFLWKRNLENDISCGNLVQIGLPRTKTLKFTLGKEYLVFEQVNSAVAFELARQVEFCGRRGWTNNRGLFLLKDRGIAKELRHRVVTGIDLVRDKQLVYDSLVEECKASSQVDDTFVFVAVVVLLVYVFIHFVFCTVGYWVNCWTFRRTNGGCCTWMFQSSINRALFNASLIAETKLRSDIALAKMSGEDRPSYYRYTPRTAP